MLPYREDLEVYRTRYPVGALQCPECGYRSTYEATFDSVGNKTYFCGPCLRGRPSATRALVVREGVEPLSVVRLQ